MLAFNETCFTSEGCVTRGATCRPDNSSEDRCLCAESGEVYDESMDYCLKGNGFVIRLRLNKFVLIQRLSVCNTFTVQ